MSHEDLSEDAAMEAMELESLKAKADLLGVSYHPSIGIAKLREKIQTKLADEPTPQEEAVPPKSATATETLAQYRARKRMEANRLVRVRITCMNPNKRDWQGEIFTVSNRLVGTIRKYVPFNNDEGWHVPEMILKMIRARKCQVFVKDRGKNGVAIKRGKLINEFSVEVLPPLTPEELKDLAQRQAMAGGA